MLDQPAARNLPDFQQTDRRAHGTLPLYFLTCSIVFVLKQQLRARIRLHQKSILAVTPTAALESSLTEHNDVGIRQPNSPMVDPSWPDEISLIRSAILAALWRNTSGQCTDRTRDRLQRIYQTLSYRDDLVVSEWSTPIVRPAGRTIEGRTRGDVEGWTGGQGHQTEGRRTVVRDVLSLVRRVYMKEKQTDSSSRRVSRYRPDRPGNRLKLWGHLCSAFHSIIYKLWIYLLMIKLGGVKCSTDSSNLVIVLGQYLDIVHTGNFQMIDEKINDKRGMKFIIKSISENKQRLLYHPESRLIMDMF